MEYQDEFDINTYDFGARNYDPPLPRDCISNPQLIVNKNRKALLDKALRFYCDHLNW